MKTTYTVRFFDDSRIPTMADIVPDFFQTEYSCGPDEEYFYSFYLTLQEAERAISEALTFGCSNRFVIHKVYG
jgi:hypothetical protein